MIAITSERKIAAANEAAEHFFGYGRHELDALPVDVLVPPRLRQPNAPPPLAIKDFMTVEAPGLRKDGAEIPTVWIFGSASSPRGPIFLMVVKHRDHDLVAPLRVEALVPRESQLADGASVRGESGVEALIASMDWSTSPIGASSTWPMSLRTVLRLMISSRYAMWMGWGPELTFFCNDTYRRQTLGKKYPWAIGRPAREVWAEIWDVIGPRIQHVLTSGEATWDEGLLLFLERSGYPEETYHSFSYSAAPADEEGQTGGLFCVVVEETERVIGERRIALLGRFAALLSQVKSLEDVGAALSECLTSEPRDVPFSLTYLFDADAKTAKRLSLTGFDPSDAAAAETLRVEDRAHWPLVPLLSRGAPGVVNLDRNTQWPRGPWKLSPTQAVMLPIARSTGEGRPVGVMIAGLNPHRPYDDQYREFLSLLVGQLAAGLSTAGAYQAEKERAEALADVDRAKTMFFSNVSHEFRTPLTLMLGPLEDALTSGQALGGENLETAHRNALRLLKLVNALLDFSRIEAGRMQASYEKTDLASFTGELASVFRSAMERAGLRFVVDIPADLSFVHVDRDMWEKIVLNLLSNALKFTFEGEVRVSLRERDRDVVLSVQDTGTGVPVAELPHLFERFHRVRGAKARTQEGSGIGLALVSELVKLHGGEIRAESVEGKGTTFEVRIPTGVGHLPADRIAPERSLSRAVAGAAPYVEEALRWLPSDSLGARAGTRSASAAAAEGPRIVLADDNADMREYVARLLEAHWRVEAVADGEAALAAVRRGRPALVLSDVMMPRLDGFGLLRAIRSDPSLSTVPFIMLSARAGEEATAEGLQAGANDYLIKPFSARELLARVSAQIAIGQLREETAIAMDRLHRLGTLFLADPTKLEPVLLEVVDAAITIAGADFGNIQLIESASSDLRIVAHRGFPDWWLAFWNTVSADKGSCGAALERRERVVVEDVEQSPIFVGKPALQMQRRAGVRAVVSTPMLSRTGKPIGMFSTHFRAPHRPDERTLQLLDLLARQAADIIELATSMEALRKSEEQFRSLASELGQASRAKDEFLATMSHELRTPLNAMLGWAAILKQDPSDPAKVKRGVTVIERNARTQARIVSDLLDVSRIISGKLRLSLKATQISSVIYAAADVVRPAADSRGVRLVLDLDPEVGTVLCDPERLQQVVWNLLSNAVRFTPKGGRVTVTAHRIDSSLRILVEDTGAGIAAEHLPHIFERFRQVDSSTTRTHGGLGLGLAIVRHLVEAHGGTVSAVSEGPGRGSTFEVALPVRAVSVASDPAQAEAEPEAVVARKASGLEGSLASVRVLVVDDDRDSLELVRLVLEGAGANVTTVTSAAAALECREPFDVIISDIAMPGTDGYAFMKRVRSRDAGATVPAIALTAYAHAEDAERALRAGYQEHLAKPVEAEALIEAVKTWTRWASSDVPRAV
ncbi:MAG TPA: ATP-binding protein [Polyangiaceae bacterium]|nr:ATP-binding protein [Polyangiaceae bacterium]